MSGVSCHDELERILSSVKHLVGVFHCFSPQLNSSGFPVASGPPSCLCAEPPEPSTSALHLDNDEALALRLQRELDREAGQAESVDLEDRGLFFCQICHRDVSHMTPEGRTQHLNRSGHLCSWWLTDELRFGRNFLFKS